MNFIPVVPFSGNLGWSFLQRTREAQQEAHDTSPRLSRNTEYFKAKIGNVLSAQELVADRQLLEVALGAFGLDGDLGNKFYIEKILESDTSDPRSLANRLSDKRYLAFAKAFGFGDTGGASIVASDFAERITTSYKDRQFEFAVGEQNPDLRLAMGLERDLGNIAERTSLSDNARWYTVMATPPLRKVFEAALGLPKSFGALPIEQQLTEFRERSQRIFGVSEVAEFNEPERITELNRQFLVRSELAAGPPPGIRGSAALALLQFGQ